MSESTTISEAAIFARLWDSKDHRLTPLLARHLLKMRFSGEDTERMHELAAKNQADKLYCRLPQRYHSGPFEFEHVIAQKHGGPTRLGNLAYSCLHCNRHKGSDLTGL